MSRFYLRLTLIPVVLFTSILLLIRAQPYDDHELRDLLLPEGCPAPCFMGIRPGVTTMDEAIKLLEASGWVENVQDQPFGISWRWNNRKPEWSSAGINDGGIIIMNSLNLIDTVTLYTNISIGEVKLTFGSPDIETLETNQWKQVARYFSMYNKYGLSISYYIDCDMVQPFRSPITITIDKPINEKTTHMSLLNGFFRIC